MQSRADFPRGDDDTLSLSAGDLAEELDKTALPFSHRSSQAQKKSPARAEVGTQTAALPLKKSEVRSTHPATVQAATFSPTAAATPRPSPMHSVPDVAVPAVVATDETAAPVPPNIDAVEPALVRSSAVAARSVPDEVNMAAVAEKRTIGEVLAHRPSLAKSSPRMIDDDTPALPSDVRPDRVGGALRTTPHSNDELDGTTSPATHDPLELIFWCADEAVARLRKDPQFKARLGPSRAAADSDARVVGRVARSVAPTSIDRLEATLRDAVRDGVIEAPLALLDGLLELSFDPSEELRVLLSAALPFSRGHEKLTRAIESAKAVTEGDLSEALWMLAGGELAALRNVMAISLDKARWSEIERATERKLTLEKKVCRANLLGESRVVVRLASREQSPATALVYVSEETLMRWPIARRFRARVVAEVRPSLDEDDALGAALFPIAIYRAVAFDRSSSDT